MKRKNNNIQSVLFDKKGYDKKTAEKMLHLLGYNNNGVDETDKYYRYRQFNPGLHENPKYKTIKSNNYSWVKFIIEY